MRPTGPLTRGSLERSSPSRTSIRSNVGLEASEEAREYAESLIETVREPSWYWMRICAYGAATAAFYETFLVSREETEGRYLYDLGNGQWNQPRLRELLGWALFKSEPFQDFEIEHDFPHIGRRTMRLNARRIPQRDPQQRTNPSRDRGRHRAA